jgi:hypothetical protein
MTSVKRKQTKRQDLIPKFSRQWEFARGLTRDLLGSLEPADLAFTPSDQLGPLWKHFRHLGRVQESYLRGLRTGSMVFGVEGATYAGGGSKGPLRDYLDRLDANLRETLPRLDPDAKIHWFGNTLDTYEHLRRMAGHEILHHGMFIAYMRILQRPFPPSWAEWGEA